MRAAMVNLATVVVVGLEIVFGVFAAEMFSKEFTPTYEIVVSPNGESDLYACEEDSPPPCVWDCATMGNKTCGVTR